MQNFSNDRAIDDQVWRNSWRTQLARDNDLSSPNEFGTLAETKRKFSQCCYGFIVNILFLTIIIFTLEHCASGGPRGEWWRADVCVQVCVSLIMCGGEGEKKQTISYSHSESHSQR